MQKQAYVNVYKLSNFSSVLGRYCLILNILSFNIFLISAIYDSFLKKLDNPLPLFHLLPTQIQKTKTKSSIDQINHEKAEMVSRDLNQGSRVGTVVFKRRHEVKMHKICERGFLSLCLHLKKL